jgi:hypothetical protein
MNAKNSIRLEDHQPYRIAVEKLGEFQGQLTAAEREISALISTSEDRRRLIEDPVTRQAKALISGEAAPSVENESQELNKARSRCTILRRAIELQRATADRERDAASQTLCERLQPDHRRLVADLAQAVINLGKAAEAEENFRDHLIASGVTFTPWLRPMAFPAAMHPRESYSRIAAWLREAVVWGFIKRNEIPDSWLEAWGALIDAEIRDNQRPASQAQPGGAPPPANSSRRREGWLHV